MQTTLRTSDAGSYEEADRDSIGKIHRGIITRDADELDRLGFDDVRNRSDRAHLNPVGQFVRALGAWRLQHDLQLPTVSRSIGLKQRMILLDANATLEREFRPHFFSSNRKNLTALL
jgi:hypothetical protein